MKRALLLALTVALAACGDQAAAPADEEAQASGEVLPATVSDAMIPLEQLDSEAPLAPRQVQETGEDIDAEQPEVTPVEGIDAAPAPGAETAPAPAPAPEQ